MPAARTLVCSRSLTKVGPSFDYKRMPQRETQLHFPPHFAAGCRHVSLRPHFFLGLGHPRRHGQARPRHGTETAFEPNIAL